MQPLAARCGEMSRESALRNWHYCRKGSGLREALCDLALRRELLDGMQFEKLLKPSGIHQFRTKRFHYVVCRIRLFAKLFANTKHSYLLFVVPDKPSLSDGE